MRFGRQSMLAIELEPRDPTWDRSSIADIGPWAKLTVFLKDKCITSFVEGDAQRYETGINVPLAPIADWLVTNIRAITFEETARRNRYGVNLHAALASWRTRVDLDRADDAERELSEQYHWYSRHFLLANGEGLLLPDLALVRSDEYLWVSWARPQFAGPLVLEFMEHSGLEHVPWADAFAVLDEFVSYVARELCSRNLTQYEWAKQETPLRTAAQCSAEEFIAYFAENGTGILESLGIKRDSNPDTSIALQVVRDLDLSAIRRERAFDVVSEMDRHRGAQQRTLDELREGVAMAKNAGTVEAAGRDAARWLRHEHALNGSALKDDVLLGIASSIASIREVDVRTRGNDSAIGAEAGKQGSMVLFMHERTRKLWAKRMEVARAIGHLLLDSYSVGKVMGAASSRVAHSPRRRRSGAFAAELLMPIDGVLKVAADRDAGDPDVFHELMEYFGVGARTAAYHLWNSQLLRSPYDRDYLIERYGAIDPMASWK